MNADKIAPVLTDDEIINALRPMYHDAVTRETILEVNLMEARAIEQAVLARVGAVRDQALQDAIEAIGTVTWSVGNSVAGELAAEWTGRSMSEARDAIRALKGTPAAAVADAPPVAWGAFARGRLFAHCGTESEIDSYIQQVHLSRDDVTLCKGPLFTAPQPSGNPGLLAAIELPPMPRHSLTRVDHETGESLRGYTEGQMREYARAAIAASKEGAGS